MRKSFTFEGFLKMMAQTQAGGVAPETSVCDVSTLLWNLLSNRRSLSSRRVGNFFLGLRQKHVWCFIFRMKSSDSLRCLSTVRTRGRAVDKFRAQFLKSISMNSKPAHYAEYDFHNHRINSLKSMRPSWSASTSLQSLPPVNFTSYSAFNC